LKNKGGGNIIKKLIIKNFRSIKEKEKEKTKVVRFID